MIVIQVATDITTDTDAEEFTLKYSGGDHIEGIFQTEFESDAGTGDVNLQGRLHSDAPWQTLVTHTASNSAIVALFPQMRIGTASVSGATINCWIGY